MDTVMNKREGEKAETINRRETKECVMNRSRTKPACLTVDAFHDYTINRGVPNWDTST